MQRHVNDEYVKRSKREGYRSRAAYKLLELQEKDSVLKPGQVVVDLGAAPRALNHIPSTTFLLHVWDCSLYILPFYTQERLEVIRAKRCGAFA